MALIPPDAGLQLRSQTESQLQPLAPVQRIPADLPDLQVGQLFTARIQEVLPENTYKALVAGKMLTLQLPEGAASGDTLELVVIDRSPKVVVAKLAGEGAQAANEPYPYATLSRAGQLISNLLPPEGKAPQPAILNRGDPLLPQPPSSAAELAPALQKAVEQSGLFYESHQAQWVAGKLPLQQLMQEPQGQYSPAASAAQRTRPPNAALPPDNAPVPAQAQAAAGPSFLQVLFGEQEPTAPAAASQQQAQAPLAQAVPEPLRPIVQQQLDAVATQRFIWHGEAWPGQSIDWEVIREEEQGPATAEMDDLSWRTTLKLDTPRLGHVEASLRLTSAGIHLALATPSEDSVADLRGGTTALVAAFDAAGIPILSLQVKRGTE